MSKSILIFDTPKRCGECSGCASYAVSAFSPIDYWCVAAENKDVSPDSKPNWCPLKPLPEERLVWYDDAYYEMGYNSCLRDIIGDED